MILKNYFWTTPAERDTISAVLTEICDNPIQSRINDLIAMADEAFEDFQSNSTNNRAFAKARTELVRLFSELQKLECTSDTDRDKVKEANEQLESLSKQVYEQKGFTVVPLRETYEQSA